MKSKRICFVAENVYPLLSNSTKEFIGGAELQQSIIGKYMAKNGFAVAYITRILDGRKHDEVIEGIKIYKAYDPNGGIPLFRYFHPKISSLWSAMKRADADIYYQRCSSYITGIVAMFCKRYGKTFVYSAAHDNNFLPDIIEFPHLSDKILYYYGLRNADHIIVQTENQKNLLDLNFNLKGNVINNVFEMRPLTKDEKYVLWVSNIKEIKRPFLVLEIAKMYPDVQFKMIGGPVEKKMEYFEKFRRASLSVENVEFLGFQRFENAESYFDGASVFLNTSEMEGFPNTFLQAWSRGIPTLSFVDVDNAISRNGLGGIINHPRRDDLKIDEHLNCPISERKRIQRYFEDRYSVSVYVKKFENLIFGSSSYT